MMTNRLSPMTVPFGGVIEGFAVRDSKAPGTAETKIRKWSHVGIGAADIWQCRSRAAKLAHSHLHGNKRRGARRVGHEIGRRSRNLFGDPAGGNARKIPAKRLCSTWEADLKALGQFSVEILTQIGAKNIAMFEFSEPASRAEDNGGAVANRTGGFRIRRH